MTRFAQRKLTELKNTLKLTFQLIEFTGVFGLESSTRSASSFALTWPILYYRALFTPRPVCAWVDESVWNCKERGQKKLSQDVLYNLLLQTSLLPLQPGMQYPEVWHSSLNSGFWLSARGNGSDENSNWPGSTIRSHVLLTCPVS